jgi:adenylosuccinate lyase
LAPYFSEYALIRYRVRVEILYLIELHATGIRPLQPLSQADQVGLMAIDEAFDEGQAQRVKDIEQRTNHDVKAVEYYLKECIHAGTFSDELRAQSEFIHFGLTSQDINNTAIPLSLRDALHAIYLPQLDAVISQLEGMAQAWRGHAMLARTHGQPASPTTLGKEIAVFVARLQQQREGLARLPMPAKFGGATGNLNAHYVAYPDQDWQAFAQHFVEETLGLSRSYPTTQIDHYDGLAAIFDQIKRINTVIIDLCQDMWLYVSQEYFRQEVKAGEVGSSAMPHKVNPIDFENAEGNGGLSTALLEFLSRKLPVSRLQRDLTDSTVLRNVGSAMGYALLALLSVEKGLTKLRVNPLAMQQDLDANWAVLAEAIQTILRREGYPKPYEALKDLTRGQARIDAQALATFVEGLSISAGVKAELMALRPERYLGDADRLPG